MREMRAWLLAPIALAASTVPVQRVELVRAIDGAGDEQGIGVVAQADGSVLCGWVALGPKVQEALLERLDREGEVVWRRTFPGGDDCALWSIRELAGGGFAAAGWSRSARGDLDALCVRVSASGEVLWTRSWEGPGDDRLWSLDQAGEELVAAGESAAAGRSSVLVLRIGLDGELRERRTHGDAEVERAFAVQCLPDGGYALAGLAGSGPREGPGFDARIAAWDPAGRETWRRDFGGSGFDVAHDLRRAPDGTLHVVGYTDAGAGRGMDGFLLVLSAAGEIVDSNTFGGPGDDRAVHMELLPGGGHAIVGYAREGEDWDVVLRTLDPSGTPTWEQRFGGDAPELGRSLALAPDGKLWVVGHSRSHGPHERILVLRIDLSES